MTGYPDEMSDMAIAQDDPTVLQSRGLRLCLLAFGWLNVGLGVIGLVLPVMPTTVSRFCFFRPIEKLILFSPRGLRIRCALNRALKLIEV